MKKKRKQRLPALTSGPLGKIGSGNIFADLGLPDAEKLLRESRQAIARGETPEWVSKPSQVVKKK